YRQVELARERPVALIMCRHGHYRASAIARQHIVAYPHRYLGAVERIYRLYAFERHAGLVLVQLGALEVALARGRLAVLHHRVPVRYLGLELIDELVFGRQHHVRRAKQRIRPSSVYAHDVFAVSQLEVYLGAFGTAYPVALLRL